MPRNVLKTTFEANFHLLGIACNLPDYQLAWLVNQALGINLVRVADHNVSFKQDRFIHTAKFIYRTENVAYTFLKNRAEEGEGQNYLIPEVKNIDYLLMIDDETENLEILNVKSTLSKINNVILTQVIDVSQLKSIENLIAD